MSDWNSPEMRRAIRKHDRKFARRHGSVYGKPKSGCPLAAAVLVAVPLSVWPAWFLLAGGAA